MYNTSISFQAYWVWSSHKHHQSTDERDVHAKWSSVISWWRVPSASWESQVQNSQVSRTGFPFVQIIKIPQGLYPCPNRYYLKGPKKGTSEVFMENLPGAVDNIRRSSSGGYWVASASCRHSKQYFNLLDSLGPRPWLRSLICKVCDSQWTISPQ